MHGQDCNASDKGAISKMPIPLRKNSDFKNSKSFGNRIDQAVRIYKKLILAKICSKHGFRMARVNSDKYAPYLNILHYPPKPVN